MDRVYNKEEKAIRKGRDDGERDRDSSNRDDKHRSNRDGRSRDSVERYQGDKYRERSHEPIREEGSRDERDIREERRPLSTHPSHKRKERGDSEELFDKHDKRAKLSKEEKRDKHRFEDRHVDDTRDLNAINREERKERRRRTFEDGANEDDDMRAANKGSNRKERIERRRFGDRVKEENVTSADMEKQQNSVVKLEIKETVDERVDNEAPKTNGSVSIGNNGAAAAAALEPSYMTSRIKTEASAGPDHPPPTKVSSISSALENKRVCITRSHEFPGKSSTDGTTTSAAAKSGSLSFDALAKAKKALQMQKELSEKLKKIPLACPKNTETGIQCIKLNYLLEMRKLEIKETVDERVDNEAPKTNGSVSIGNNGAAALEPLYMTSRIKPEASAGPDHPPPTKVSSISSALENKRVCITRSHEFPGKSSTDGTTTSAAAKSGSLLLDALAKAKKALQMQKELSEKLKKIPLLNKAATSSSGGTSQSGLNAERPKASSTSVGVQHASAKPSASGMPTLPGLANVPNIEAVKRAQELSAKMGFHQDPEFAPLINMFPGQMPVEVAVQQKPAKARVLRLDALGREIDEHGNVINMPKLINLSTLKVNINKQKKEDPESNPHYDESMGINKAKLLRPTRMSFEFVERGSWLKQAEIIKFKSEFGEARDKELKAKQAQLAKAKAEPDINPNLIEVSERIIAKERPKDVIPDVEWWDAPLLLSGTYGDITEDGITEDKLKIDKITIYVEHPLPIEPPAEPAPLPPQPLKLTKQEQKKLRTQRRLAKEKDRQEMIRQGLLEPPKAKVKMSNLMKVLGSEATQDPTRLEMEIRSAAAEREQAHVDRNIARKLTPAERRDKKEKKLFEDPNTLETIVSVYKINDLSRPQTRFKVDVNAQENRLTGCAVIADGISVVVVEGGSKPIKRYGKLMLRRINWVAAVVNEGNEEDPMEGKPVNKCSLVWQGSVAKPGFHRFFVDQCRTKAAAKKVFTDAGVGHYWDLAINFSDDQF